jgi:4-amino-4-deoxy-L-arabinose transferase-like glycosyltransferase
MWLAWAALNGAPQEYFSDLLFRQNVSRSAGALGHVQPVYYYLLHFPLELLPWTLFLLAAWFALRDPPEMTVLRRRLLGWALFVIAFFSMSPSKRQLYILLAYPAAAMLVAVSWDRIKGRWMKVAAHGAAAMVGLIGWGSLAAALYPRLPFSGWVLLPSGVAMAAGAGVLWATIRRRGPSTAWFATLTALLVWQEIALGAWILPALNPLKTPVELARAARDLLPADEKLLLYKINGEILAFYCGVQGKLLQNADELQAEIARRGRGIVAFEAADWASLQSRFAGTLVAHPFRMGNKKLVWCEFGGTGRPSPSHETD